MAAASKFNIFVLDLTNKIHNLGSDTLKVALTNTAPVAANAVLADITEIAAANGYSAGGATATLVSSTQTSGTYKLVLSQPTFTASGGSINTFRYAYLYNGSTATVTATMAAILLKPGDVTVFHPSTSAVTLQSTTAATDIQTVITEA